MKNKIDKFKNGLLDKHAFIKMMFDEHHSQLFEYSDILKKTNIQKIEIRDEEVIMTTRDRGVKMICSKGDYRTAPIDILNFFDYEKEETSMLENLVSNGDNFIDIGANIGWYSINIGVARRAAKIFSFEPIPNTYNNLIKNISINAVSNIQTYNFGFSNIAGEFPFYYYPEGSGNASSANLTERNDIEIVQCKVRTLDDFSTDKKLQVDFIKCDVEGAELLVFQGGMQTLEKNLPIIFAEILRKWSNKFNYDPNEIFILFKKLGYQAFTVKGPILVKFEEMNESTVETNFFFLHKEKHIKLIQTYT
jgi:FkbM family methyltransferase